MTKIVQCSMSKFSLLTVVMLLIACTTDTSRVELPTPSPQVTLTSNQMRPTLTHTVRPTMTPAPSVVSPSPTLTLPPPLQTKEEALVFIKEMQETNGGCQLPCWWGITPGKTIARDAMIILYPLSNFKGLRSEYGFSLDEYSNIDVVLFTKGTSKPVESIGIYSSIPLRERTMHYDTSWQGYFVAGLLKRLGSPSEVWLGFGRPTGDTNPNPPESIPFSYELFIFYADLGIEAQYRGAATEDNLHRACLSLEQLRSLRLFIQQPSAGPRVGPPAEPFLDVRPLPEVTGLSIKEFYETFKNPENQVCLESPASF